MKIVLKAFVGLILLLLLFVAAGLLFIGTPYFSAKLGTMLTHKSGRNIVLAGNIEAHIWSREPHVVITGVKVGNAEWGSSPTMFEAKRIDVSLRLKDLLKGRIVLPELILDEPKILLEKNAKGEANWDFSQNPQASVIKKPIPQSRFGVPVIQKLNITQGMLHYIDPVKKINTSMNISTISGGDTNSSLAIKGKGSYQNAPFLLDVNAASILQLRESNAPYPFSIKTTVGDTVLDVKGTVKDPVKMQAVDVELAIKGKNAAELFPITGIALPPTPAYSIKGHLVGNADEWHFNRFSGRLGDSDLKGNIVWHPGERGKKQPYFEGAFESENLDMKDLSGLIGGQTKPEDETRVIPDTPLDISRLLAMDADVTLNGRHIKTSSLLNNFYLNLSLKDGVLTIKPVSFGIAKGKIEANITIHGKQMPPQVTLDVLFEKLSLRELFAPLAKDFGKNNVSSGILGGKATLKGQGKSLRDILATSNGEIGIGMEGGVLSHLLLDLAGIDIMRSAGLLVAGDNPVNINCMVSDFSVDQGIMNTQAFLIDTDVTSIHGKGTISLRDETFDLHMHVYPKEASLISARSPLSLKGTFKHPSPGVDATSLVIRGAAAAGLAIIVPPAALLAFIEPGLGKDSNCAATIRKMNEDTGASVPKSKEKPRSTENMNSMPQ